MSQDFKVVMVGDAFVGKTTLAVVFTSEKYRAEYVPTICERYDIV